eukprot:s3908_g6.t1
MHELPHCIKGHYAVRAFRLLDGRGWYDAEVFCARTTLVRKANGSWIQIENSADYNYEAIPYGPIANRGCECITLFRMESFGEGFFDGQGMAPKASTRFAPDPADEEMGFLAGPPRTPEAEDAQPRTPAEDPAKSPAPPGAGAGLSEDDQAEGTCMEEMAAGHAAKETKKVLERAPMAVTEPAEVPSAAEVKQHRLTHMPYASWCSACVKTRGRGDKHGKRKDLDRVPVIQIDFFYTTVDPDGRPTEEELPEHPCNLVAVDLDTRMVLAVPNKGGPALKRYVEELLRFTIALHDQEHIILQYVGWRTLNKSSGEDHGGGPSKPMTPNDPTNHTDRRPPS